MKKLIFATIAFLAFGTFGLSEASAELITLLSNDHKFAFDPNAGVNGQLSRKDDTRDVLGNMAVFLGYKTDNFANVQTIQLTDGTVTGAPNTTGFGFNEGQITFAPVMFNDAGGDVTLQAVMDFELIDTVAGGGEAFLKYDLQITGTGFTGQNSGITQSFVGFDFEGTGTDVRETGSVVAGLGTGATDAQIGILGPGAGTKSLFADGSFPPATNIDQIDIYDATAGILGANPAERFDGMSTAIAAGPNLAVGFFSTFNTTSVDFTENTLGAVGIRSTALTAAIPEPTSLALAAIGFGMVVSRRKRRAV